MRVVACDSAFSCEMTLFFLGLDILVRVFPVFSDGPLLWDPAAPIILGTTSRQAVPSSFASWCIACLLAMNSCGYYREGTTSILLHRQPARLEARGVGSEDIGTLNNDVS